MTMQQWKKAELCDWAHGWTRTPFTVLAAFIDAGFCSDEEPLREETRLLRHSDTSTVDATKPVMPELLPHATKRLRRAVWDLRTAPNREDVRILLDAYRRVSHPEPPKGVRTWYRGWECVWSATSAQWTGDGWYACFGGEDLDCITVSALTWDGLLDEIDDHDKTGEAA